MNTKIVLCFLLLGIVILYLAACNPDENTPTNTNESVTPAQEVTITESKLKFNLEKLVYAQSLMLKVRDSNPYSYEAAKEELQNNWDGFDLHTATDTEFANKVLERIEILQKYFPDLIYYTTSKASIKYTTTSNCDKWICICCGWIYDVEEGDTYHGVPAGTPFEDLPDDWGCPNCGCVKDDFECTDS